MDRRIFLFSALLGLALIPAGCNRSTKKRIGVVPKAVAHVFWQSVHAGAVAAGESDFMAEFAPCVFCGRRAFILSRALRRVRLGGHASVGNGASGRPPITSAIKTNY